VGNVLKRSLVSQCQILSLFSFTANQLANVRAVGLALHEGRGIGANKFGEIVILNHDEIEKEIDNDRRPEKGTRGSATGSRERSQGTQAPADSTRSLGGRRRARYQAEVRELRWQYPGTYFRIDDSGLWIVVPAFPLGTSGPQLIQITAVPDDPNIRILTWAFWISDDRCAWVGHRHTNYPDGSVCAFPPDGGAWKDGDPLVRYVDRICEWSARHIFCWLDGYWPGPQDAICRYYRVGEGRAQELCFCHSGKTYFECCRPLDLLQSCASDRELFKSNCNGLDIGEQRPPKQLYEYAIGSRQKLPKMRKVHIWLAQASERSSGRTGHNAP
jgi:hypothetical protein